jgi:hypothetical protein
VNTSDLSTPIWIFNGMGGKGAPIRPRWVTTQFRSCRWLRVGCLNGLFRLTTRITNTHGVVPVLSSGWRLGGPGREPPWPSRRVVTSMALARYGWARKTAATSPCHLPDLPLAPLRPWRAGVARFVVTRSPALKKPSPAGDRRLHVRHKIKVSLIQGLRQAVRAHLRIADGFPIDVPRIVDRSPSTTPTATDSLKIVSHLTSPYWRTRSRKTPICSEIASNDSPCRRDSAIALARFLASAPVLLAHAQAPTRA